MCAAFQKHETYFYALRQERGFRMRVVRTAYLGVAVVVMATAAICFAAEKQDKKPPTSYSPVVMGQSFDETVAKMRAAKPAIEAKHKALLQERYDMSDRPAKGVTMSRGKPVQEGIRAKLPEGVSSWEELGTLTPEEVRERGLWPKGFYPLPHPNHPEGGMVCSLKIRSTKSRNRKGVT